MGAFSWSEFIITADFTNIVGTFHDGDKRHSAGSNFQVYDKKLTRCRRENILSRILKFHEFPMFIGARKEPR
jgi:hypothetical protein